MTEHALQKRTAENSPVRKAGSKYERYLRRRCSFRTASHPRYRRGAGDELRDEAREERAQLYDEVPGHQQRPDREHYIARQPSI